MSDILPLLAATRAADKATRHQAEQQIDQYVQQYGIEFLQALIAAASSPQSDTADSQSALLVLKNCIVKFWSPGFEQFTGPPFSHETRETVRRELLNLLGATTPGKVRNLCALLIAQIGSLEYPDVWPDLVSSTVAMLQSDPQTPACLGGLVLFKELLLETLREEDFEQFGEQVLNQLLVIAGLPANENRTLLAVMCFHECITFLLMGDDDQLPHLEEMAARFIPPWCELFAQLLQRDFKDSSLVAEIVNAVREVDSTFPQILESQLPLLFTAAQSTLIDHLGELDDELKSNFAYLLDVALQNKVARSAVLNSGSAIDQYTSLLLQLSLISDELAEWWVDDYNEFVTAELELNTGELNPRTNAASLIAMTGQPAVLPRLLDMLSAANTSVEIEACLFLISNLLAQVDINKHLVVVDMAKFQHFLTALRFDTPTAQQNAHEQLLISRKVATAGVVAKYGGGYLPEDIKLQLAKHALDAPLADTSEVVRVSQVKALADACNLFPAAFQSHQSQCLAIVSSLVSSAEEDTPVFLAECFGSVLRVDYNLVVSEPQAIEALFALAGKDTADIDLNAQILDVVGDLLDTVSHRAVVDQILKPVFNTITEAAATQFEYTGDLYFALDLATAVFEHKSVEFSGEEREQMLQSFYQVITTTQDPQILQVTSFAYAALVQNIQTAISADSASNVLRVAAQLLNPELDDSAALASGKLISAIIDQFGDGMGSLLTELIDASAKRLATANNALLVETLVLVFCNLTLRNASAVVDILDQASMLEPVMKQWIPTFEVVRGAEEIRKNVKALQLLVELNDPRVNNLLLNDEPIRNPNEILTRRKARNIKFTQIPLPLKILKLLVRELLQSPKPPQQENGVPAPNSTLENSEDEWDDELALDNEGEIVDYRTFPLILDWFKRLASQPSMMQWFTKLSGDERKALRELSA